MSLYLYVTHATFPNKWQCKDLVMDSLIFLTMNCFILVPTTYDLSLIAHHVQKVGQPLILQCSLTAVRGITSRVNFVWSNNGAKLQENNKFGRDFTMLNLDIYTDTYTISPLSISDDGSTYQCEVIISINPPLKDVINVTLDVTGIE